MDNLSVEKEIRMKKVSLLMMTYNIEDELKKTLDCVKRQDYSNIEVVIADGGSKDRTVEIIQEFAKQTKIEVQWISEKDHGLYDALNKAVEMATGDYLLVMNDQLIDDRALSKMVQAIEAGDYDGVHSDLIYADEEKVQRYWHMGQGTLRQGWMPGHPTLMLKKEVYEKYGNYDLNFRIAADYDFMIRIIRGGIKIVYVPEILVRMYYGGTSTGGLSDYLDSLKEGHRALKKNNVKMAWTIDILRTSRVLLQFLKSKKKAEEVWREYQKQHMDYSK